MAGLPNAKVRYGEDQIYARAWKTDSVGHKLPTFINLRKSGNAIGNTM